MSHDNSAIARLRARLRTDRPAIAMAAHNPLAAKLAAEAGFDAIWGSGFELSASYAMPDANILSMAGRDPGCVHRVWSGTKRCYGAGGEEMATSSLHLTMECRDAPAKRPEQVPRRGGRMNR